MIFFQSSYTSACVLEAALIRIANADSCVVQKCHDAAFCPSGAPENAQRPARVIYGWVHFPAMNKSPAGTTETIPSLTGLKHRVHDSIVYLCAFASSLLKFGKRKPQIPKPSQGFPRLAKPIQAASPGRWEGLAPKVFGFAPPLNLFASICTQLRLLTAFSWKKRLFVFLEGPR